jgi:hypothetical protein
MARRSDALLLFDALSIEGGLLPPEWLAKVAALDAPTQKAADYHVPKGLELRDEITRYWRIAEALRADYVAARSHASDGAGAGTRRFVRDLLAQVFGFTDLAAGGRREVGGRAFEIGFEAAGGLVPVVVGVPDESLDASVARHGDGARRRSAWGVLQEYLNASEDVLWGVVSNGLRLRIGRDNTSLTRPAWIDADLDRIFEEERFADFSVLWLVLHASRFGRASGPAAECPLEAWRDAAREAGTRARDQLRDGVEAALLALGRGFIGRRDNAALRSALSSGQLTSEEYFNELLRLVYRMIFLLTIEERGILHDDAVSPPARALYAEGYGMRRLRERAVRRSQYDCHSDLWASLRPVFAALGRPGGEPALGLPELGGLFSPGQCRHLDVCALENRALLEAVFRLAWLREDSGLARVNWKDMGPEELGSVYESLLELVPRVDPEARSFDFADPGETAGSARKLTGSYYTPDSLVQQLLDTALEPVVADRLAGSPDDPERALIGITVVDPACGSGHFLLAAARRLASHLARLRAGGTPGAHEYRVALRDVVTHCIHGVDRNPMALELARMSLWLETYTPDRALGFVDHHLVLGDALLGLLDLGVLKDGIPDDAYNALTGDDREAAKTLKRLNRAARKALEKLRGSQNLQLRLGTEDLGEAFARLDELSDDAIERVDAKRARYEELRRQAESSPVALAADIYLGAFLMPKRLAEGEQKLTDRAAVERFPATGTLLMALESTLGPGHTVARAARRACREARVMHWALAFPQVFARGGFDVVVGNPPWEMLQLSEEEFFATRAPEIAGLAGATRKRAIARLDREQPQLWDAFVREKFRYEAENACHRSNPRFALTAVGKLNTYSLFAEAAYKIASPGGRAGLVLPTGIATDDSTKKFFAQVVESARLVSLYDFENREGIFPGVHRSYKFCLFTIGPSRVAEFAFFLAQVHELADQRRRFELTPEDFRLINPNTRTCPIFRSRADAELTKIIYRNVPVLIDETKPEAEGNPWGVSFSQGLFNMTTDSHLFLDHPAEGALPLYEAKMIHQFDHRWATYEPAAEGNGMPSSRNVTEAEKADPGFVVHPRYWVDERDVWRASARVPKAFLEIIEYDNHDWHRQFLGQWLAGYYLNHGHTSKGEELAARCRPIEDTSLRLMSWASPEELEKEFPLKDKEAAWIERDNRSARMIIEALIEARVPRWFMGWRDICRATDERTVIASVVPRAATGDTLLLMFPRIGPERAAALLADQCSLVHDFVARQKVGGTHLKYHMKKQITNLPPDRYSADDLEFIVPRVLELTYTAEDLRPWAEDLGYDGPPFAWNPERRALLRAELDAYYARLYSLTREQLRYMLDPAEVMGEDYPSETFRVLKNNEEAEFGEYRARRLVLEAWDRLEAEQRISRVAAATA